jgi:hypothetical protein
MELVRKFLKEAWYFVTFTIEDFWWVWQKRPNVLIWSAVLGLVLFFI